LGNAQWSHFGSLSKCTPSHTSFSLINILLFPESNVLWFPPSHTSLVLLCSMWFIVLATATFCFLFMVSHFNFEQLFCFLLQQKGMDPKCLSYEKISDVSSSTVSGTSPKKPNLEFTLGRPHWSYPLCTTHFESLLSLRGCWWRESGTQVRKSELKKKKRKGRKKEKKRRAKEWQRDSKDRKQQKVKSGKGMSFISSSEIQINILYSYVNMKSNWFCMLLHSRRKRERERETFRERWRERTLTISKYKAILGNCNGALYINIKYFHIFTKELGLYFHS